MQKIDPKEYQKRIDQISALFANMVVHAEELSRSRCPYKNRLNRCTASFGCRNQKKPLEHASLPICSGDDHLDYRSAWET